MPQQVFIEVGLQRVATVMLMYIKGNDDTYYVDEINNAIHEHITQPAISLRSRAQYPSLSQKQRPGKPKGLLGK